MPAFIHFSMIHFQFVGFVAIGGGPLSGRRVRSTGLGLGVALGLGPECYEGFLSKDDVPGLE